MCVKLKWLGHKLIEKMASLGVRVSKKDKKVSKEDIGQYDGSS